MAAGFFRGRPAFATVQTEWSFSSVVGRKAFIFVRKTLQVRPRDQHRRQAAFISRFTLDVGRAPKCLPFVRARIRHLGLSPTQACRVGPAFFDEDDVCTGFQELRFSPSERLRNRIRCRTSGWTRSLSRDPRPSECSRSLCRRCSFHKP